MSLPRLPIGDAADGLVRWLTDNFDAFFDAVGALVELLVTGLFGLLMQPPALVLALLVALLGWLVRGMKFGIFALLALALIDSMGAWEAAMSTLSLVVVSSVTAVLIGLPIGIAAARNRHVSSLTRPVLDFMQTMPVMVYLLPAIFFFGVGEEPGVVATVIFAMPPCVRLTELGIRQVDHEMVEAGEAFGTRPWRILTGIQIPLALPTIRAGVNQVIMLALSMVVIAGMVGAGGLGAEVFEGLTRLDVGTGFEAGLAVVFLAIILDRLTGGMGPSRARNLVLSVRSRVVRAVPSNASVTSTSS